MGESFAQVGEWSTHVGQSFAQVGEWSTQVGESSTQVGGPFAVVGDSSTQVGERPTQRGEWAGERGEDPVVGATRRATTPRRTGAEGDSSWKTGKSSCRTSGEGPRPGDPTE